MDAFVSHASSRAETPPGPDGSVLLGNALEFREDFLGFLTRVEGDHGDIAKLRIGHQRIWLVSRPEDIETVLVTERDKFQKPKVVRVMGKIIFGDALTTRDGEAWRTQRRALAPAFHPDRIEAYAATVVALTERALETWRDGDVRQLDRELMRLTLQIAAKTLLDLDLENADAMSDAIGSAIAGLGQRARQPIPTPDWVPVSHNLRMKRAMRHVDPIVYGAIAQRRRDPGDHGDLLSLLLSLRDETGAPLSDRHLHDEIVAMFFGGNQPSALALAWAFYCVAKFPPAGTDLAAELTRVLAGRAPAFSDIPDLSFARGVIDEAQRLYPPFFVIARDAVADMELGGFALPKGTTVFLSPWVTQRSEKYFDAPLEFRPSRWSDGLATRLHRFAYFPFSDGPRVCIARGFATMQSLLVLSTIARRFRFELVEARPVRPLPSISLMFDRGLHVVVRDVGR